MFRRILQFSSQHSFFLFGPRGVGKTTLLKDQLPKNRTHVVDLLNYELENALLHHPAQFAQLLEALPASVDWVVVDEIQKLPFLLDEVHRQIEKNPKRHFALTGSSARKLRRGTANLLAGRAFTYSLGPLTSIELGKVFDLNEALSHGTLPHLWSLSSAAEKNRYLRTYAQTYLQEEIQMEGLVRNLPGFRRFLPLAATANGQELAWSNFAQDIGVDAKTIRSYFEILEDTLIGCMLPAWRRSLRKRQKTHPKFYFFDTGVKRALAGQLTVTLQPGTDEYGRAFEHFWITEIMRMNAYREADYVLSYFATPDIEIDLIIERPGAETFLVEFKSAERVRDSDLRALATVAGELRDSRAICICRESRQRKVNDVLVCPWQDALTVLGLVDQRTI